MSYQLELSPQAEQDSNDSVDWYEEERLGLGFEFYSYIIKETQSITQLPLGYAKLGRKGLRRKVTTHFKYRIIYKVDEPQQTIKFIAVWHQHRRLRGLNKQLA